MWPTVFEIPWFDLPVRAYGLMLMIGFLGGTWWAAQRAARVKADPDLVINLGFAALIASVIGARLFYVLHYWEDYFAGRSLWAVVDITAGGMEFYGGFLGAFTAVLGYLLIKRAPLRLYMDIVTPSVMFGMGMARIGCFLNGCCWGAVCPPQIPWSVSFPYASPAAYRQWEERVVTYPAELIKVYQNGQASLINRDDLRDSKKLEAAGGNAGRPAGEDPLAWQRSHHQLPASAIRERAAEGRTHQVHPVQLYASVNGLLLAVLLNALFYRRKQHGLVAAVFFLTYPVARFLEEIIRSDNPQDVIGLTISQFVSLAILVGGILFLIAIYRMPANSATQAAPASSAANSPARQKVSKRKH